MLPVWEAYMYSLDYFEDEARICADMARAEETLEVKIILVGMALGWLSFPKMYDDTDLDPLAETEIETEEDDAA